MVSSVTSLNFLFLSFFYLDASINSKITPHSTWLRKNSFSTLSLALLLEPGHVAGCNMTTSRRRPGLFFKSHVSLVAKVSTQVHLIAWKDLMQVMKVYPEIKERFMEDMELSCNLASSDMVSESKTVTLAPLSLSFCSRILCAGEPYRALWSNLRNLNLCKCFLRVTESFLSLVRAQDLHFMRVSWKSFTKEILFRNIDDVSNY